MKNALSVIFGLLAIGAFIYFKQTKKSPVDVYNACVSMSNSCSGLSDHNRALTNYSGNYKHLFTIEQMTMQIQSLETQIANVEKVSDNTGTKEACLALGKYCLAIEKNEFMQIIKMAKGKQPDEIKVIADSIMLPTLERYNKVYDDFDAKIEAFAKANNIEQKKF